MPRTIRRLRAHRGRFRRRPEAVEAVGQAHEALGMEAVRGARRVGEVVGDAEVDGPEAGGVGVAEPARLDRGGLAGEDAHAAVGRVAGQIDQDVDAVGAHHPRHLGVRKAAQVAPIPGHGAQAFGDLVGPLHVGVAEELEPGPVLMGQHRLEEARHRVPAQIGRYVAQAQASLGLGRVVVGRRLGGQRLGMAAGPFAVGLEDRLGRIIGAVMQAQKQVRVRVDERGVELDRLAEMGHGLGALALVLEEVGEVVVGRCEVGPDLQRLLVAGHRLAHPAHVLVEVAEIDEGGDRARLKRECRAEMGFRVLALAAQLEEVGQVNMRLGELGVEGERLAVDGLGLLVPAEGHERDGEAVVGMDEVGRDFGGLAV